MIYNTDGSEIIFCTDTRKPLIFDETIGHWKIQPVFGNRIFAEDAMNPIVQFIFEYDDLYWGMTFFAWLVFTVIILWTQGHLGRRKVVTAVLGAIGVAAGLVAIFFALFWFFLTILGRLS